MISRCAFVIPVCLGMLAAPSPARTAVAASARLENAEIAGWLAKLDGHVQAKGRQDAEACAAVEPLRRLYAGADPEGRARIVAGVAAAVRSPRARPDKKTFDDRVALLATHALGGFGEPACRALIDLLDERALRKNPKLLEELLAALGATRAKPAVPVLTDYVARRDLPAVRGAARGLACFEDADGATRKACFGPAFKTLIYVHDQLGSQERGVLGFEDYWYELKASLGATLAALAGHAEKDVMAWQSWWNDNKSKDWDRAR